jgi:hypothetical protein
MELGDRARDGGELSVQARGPLIEVKFWRRFERFEGGEVGEVGKLPNIREPTSLG